jgi:hypothetical protein
MKLLIPRLERKRIRDWPIRVRTPGEHDFHGCRRSGYLAHNRRRPGRICIECGRTVSERRR